MTDEKAPEARAPAEPSLDLGLAPLVATTGGAAYRVLARKYVVRPASQT